MIENGKIAAPQLENGVEALSPDVPESMHERAARHERERIEHENRRLQAAQAQAARRLEAQNVHAASFATSEKQERETCIDCNQNFTAMVAYIGGQRLIAQRVCPECRQVRAVEEAAQASAKRLLVPDPRELRERAWAELCPPEFRLPTEQGGNTDMQRLQQEQPKWAEVVNWKPSRPGFGLLVLGNSGVCKTRCVWRLLRRAHNHGKRILWQSAARFEHGFRRAAGDHKLDEWHDQIATADVWFLDDLGKSEWSPNTLAEFFALIDERTIYHRPFICTLNDTGAELGNRMKSPHIADPLVRRLRDYCDQADWR